MRVTALELSGFRCFKEWALEPGERLTVLVGPNGAGKTNAIEALQLVTACRSFRRPRWEDVVRWGADGARVRLAAHGEDPDTEIELRVTAEGRRAYRVNGRPTRRIADVVGRAPSVVFTPDDLELVKGAADRRRATIDELGEQLSAAYAAIRADYGRIVRQRNAVLRDPQAGVRELEPWDGQLVGLGARLLARRVRLVCRMEEHARETYAGLAGGEELTLEYADKSGLQPQAWRELTEERAAEAIAASLGERAAEERRRQLTLVGPHRDDIVFAIDGHDARSFASQGQQRTVALAWKLAELRVVEDVRKRTPVLLLDDVMSELDERRREALADSVSRDVQTFVTTTNLGYFTDELLSVAKVVDLG